MVAPQKIIGQRLRRERVANGWRQRTLAEKIGTTEGTINRWEQGKNAPDSYYRERLCEVFGKTHDELFGLPESEHVTTPVNQISPTIDNSDREKAGGKPKYTTIDGIPVIGRDQSIQEILSILETKDTRLLFLVGLPGVGKTELAKQVRLEAEKQGLFTSVETLYLENETNTQNALKRIHKELQVLPQLTMDTQILFILDNCEQLEGLTTELERVLEKHRQLYILATSRKRKRRNDFPVNPLEAPQMSYPMGYEPIEVLQNYDSLKLFLESVNVNRKKRKDNLFEITENNAEKIAHLCSALGGLPLMVCMVGSRVNDLGLEEVYRDFLSGDLYGLKDPYKDKADRHISIGSAIRWSYDKLEPDEQKLFRRLGIFAGECSCETAAAVCNLDDLPKEEDDFLDIVQTLHRHSLVTGANRRIRIAHITLRDYARRK